MTVVLLIAYLAFNNYQIMHALPETETVKETAVNFKAYNQDVNFILNDNTLFNAKCLVNIGEEYFCFILALISAIWVTTIVLLYGVFTNSARFICFWLYVFVIQLVGSVSWLTYEYFHLSSFDDVKFTLMRHLSTEMVPWAIFLMFTRYLERADDSNRISTPPPPPIDPVAAANPK